MLFFALLEEWTPNLPDCNIASSWHRLETVLKTYFINLFQLEQTDYPFSHTESVKEYIHSYKL